MQKRKPVNQALALLLAMLMIVTVFAGCDSKKNESSSAAGNAEFKTITLTVTHGDGSSKDFTIETSQEMLGAALLDEKLIEGEDGEFGLFVTTVDGETADDGNQEWWCLTIDGESAMTGVDSTPVEDGGAYGLTLTVGY